MTASCVTVGALLVHMTSAAFWPYDWSRFPAAWFGANATNWESPAQIEEIGRYSMAILGWQHLAGEDNMTAVIYPQLTQAIVLKEAHPSLPVLVYTSFGWAFGMNAAVWPLMGDSRFADFFLQSTGGSFEFSRTNCYQMHTQDRHCVGYFWNFANGTARDYYLEHIVAPLALAPGIDGVFFDAVNYGYAIPEVRPWGKPVLNIPNCSTPATSGGPVGWGGCEALLHGTLDVAQRSAALLNAHGKVPIFANPASFKRPPTNPHIWLDEARLTKALGSMHWLTYYESFRGDVDPSSKDGGGLLANMLTESNVGVAAAVHTYYRNASEDPMPHVAAFMLARMDHWYYLGSTGWWDDSYAWSDLYDAVSRCGKPLRPSHVNGQQLYTREFEGCSVRLNCSTLELQEARRCLGNISYSS